MLRPNFLAFREYRYLKATCLLIAVVLVLYWITLPEGGESYGGTWFGYVLGILSAAIVLVLMWYGIRKRRTPRVAERRIRTRRQLMHAPPGGSSDRSTLDRREIRADAHWRHGFRLEGWLSAHVYLGVALIILTSLHSGLRLGWNLHSLTYVLLLMVVVSGLYGTFAYLHYPRLIAENLHDGGLEDLLLEIAKLDELARTRAQALPPNVSEVIARACQKTRIDGTFLQQLRGRPGDCPTEVAVQQLQELGKELVSGDQPRLFLELYTLLLNKQRMLSVVWREISLNARMQCWLYLHAPLSIALIASLMAHIATVLIYW